MVYFTPPLGNLIWKIWRLPHHHPLTVEVIAGTILLILFYRFWSKCESQSGGGPGPGSCSYWEWGSFRSVYHQVPALFAPVVPLIPHGLQKEQDLGKLELLNVVTDSWSCLCLQHTHFFHLLPTDRSTWHLPDRYSGWWPQRDEPRWNQSLWVDSYLASSWYWGSVISFTTLQKWGP